MTEVSVTRKIILNLYAPNNNIYRPQRRNKTNPHSEKLTH